jgi:hypothetical protein
MAERKMDGANSFEGKSEGEEEQRLNQITDMLYEAMPVKGEPLGKESFEETAEQRLDRLEEDVRRLERKIDRLASRLGLPDAVIKGLRNL